MLKTIVTIIVSFSLLIGGTIYEQTVVLKQFDELSNEVKTCIIKAESDTLTMDDVYTLQQNWEKKKKYLHAFLPHNEIKEIGLWISEAISYTAYENEEELVDKLQVLYDLAVQVPENFKIRLNNIF